MKIKLSGNRDWLESTLKDIAGIFNIELTENAAEARCVFQIEWDKQQLTAMAVFSFSGNGVEKLKELATEVNEEDINNQEKRLVKKVFYQGLQKITGSPGSPWGILTGIRPGKLVHRLLDRQYTPKEIHGYLMEKFLIVPEKCGLLLETALNQRKFLLSPGEAGWKIGIYVGIPFCPSRCNYCSFPAYSLADGKELYDRFLAALAQEIKAVGRYLSGAGLTVEHIYLGGGTPTSLAVPEMDHLLNQVNRYLRGAETVEVTVEGGRPDTLSREKLGLLAEHAVTRVSVNPQTLQDKTLCIIGRRHTAADFWQAYFLAKEIGFAMVNVDLIVGLPGETIRDLDDTLSQLDEVELDNLTIHVLALKRASKLMESGDSFFPRDKEILCLQKLTGEFARAQGLAPYYLYRQKRILGQGENVGYSRPGLECIYNIQMIEERQTIIGMGSAAGSKWVNPRDWTLTATYNPKDPATYINNIEHLIDRKLQFIDKLKVIG